VRAAALGFLALALSGLAQIAAAQTVPVRSGEHAGFSRLVLDIGAERDWRLEGEGESRRLVLDPPVAGFATDGVFELIPRDRLAGLVAGEGLELRLACPCPVEATRYQARYLVIDIRDPVPGAITEDVTEVRQAERLAAAERLPDMTRLLTGARVGPGAQDIGPAMAPQTAPAPPAGNVDLETAARLMAEQLARAAASGLLDAAPGRPMTDADPRQAPSPDPDPDRGAGADVPEAHSPALPLRAGTAFDAALRAASVPVQTRAAPICPEAPPPIAAWSASGRFDQGLGPLRLALFDARDRLQRDAVILLARHYLYYGFGAEAAFWLGQIDAPPPELAVIAGLVDGMPGPHFPPEPDPLICSDEDLLWRYLDDALGTSPLTETEVGRLQRVTAALPQALRDQIAPRVARRLQADGFGHAARNLRDLLWRAGTLPRNALHRLDLELGLVPGGPEAMRAALGVALRDDGADPVGAMAQAMAFERSLGATIPAGRVVAAEALLRETGIGPDTAPLWHEIVLARARAGEIAPMLDLLSREGLTEDDRMRTLTDLFADRAEAGDTPTLYILARLFGDAWVADGSEAGRARVAAIARLRAAGLIDAAEGLRAGQRLLILPARPAPPPHPQDMLRSVWHSGDWPRLAAGALPPHAGIAARMVDAPAAEAPAFSNEGEAALSVLVARIADSRALRDEVAALLAAPAPAPTSVEAR